MLFTSLGIGYRQKPNLTNYNVFPRTIFMLIGKIEEQKKLSDIESIFHNYQKVR